jgi:hypothetical protein
VSRLTWGSDLSSRLTSCLERAVDEVKVRVETVLANLWRLISRES